MADIQPLHVTLATFLNARLFRIPEYQRSYSWTNSQRKDLFDDINRVYDQGGDRTHFMATVVGLRREKKTIRTTEYQVVEVVDGQQRITTLLILLKAIAITADLSSDEEKRTYDEINELLVKDDRATLLLLQTNHDTSHYFANYLREGKHPGPEDARTIADKEILSAMRDCERFVADWKKDDQSILELVIFLKNRLTFIIHEISNEALVYSVFEVLNSRGLEVSWFDRLKSMLMAIVFEETEGDSDLIDEVHKLWAEIYQIVGLRIGLGTESLRFAATLKSNPRPNRPLSEQESVELLRGRSQDEVRAVIETSTWLKDVTAALDVVQSNHRQRTVTRIVHARMVATAINLRTDLSKPERDRVLRRWETTTFRIFGMYARDARSAIGDYVRLAWRIVNENPTVDEMLRGLSAMGTSFPIDKAVDCLRKADCYSEWGDELRYFFYRYEEHLAARAGQKFHNEQWNRIWASSATSSIEHIRPQSRFEVDDDRVHHLGNLMLLPPGLNSLLGAKPVTEKADSYTGTGLLLAGEVANQVRTWNINRDWTYAAIEVREKDLLSWALEEWAD